MEDATNDILATFIAKMRPSQIPKLNKFNNWSSCIPDANQVNLRISEYTLLQLCMKHSLRSNELRTRPHKCNDETAARPLS